MKSFHLFLCLTVICFLKANAQTTLVLKNGEYVSCKDSEIVKNPDQIIIEAEGKVVCYPVEKVRGYFKAE